QQLPHDAQVDAWDARTGTFMPAFPRLIEDTQFLNNPVVADVSGDGHAEILAGSGGYFVHAYDLDGNEPRGWPKFTGNWIIAAPAIGPPPGRLGLAVTPRQGQLFVCNGRGKPDARPWPR